MRTYLDLVKRTIIRAAAVVLAIPYRAGNVLVCMFLVHNYYHACKASILLSSFGAVLRSKIAGLTRQSAKLIV